MVGSTLLSVEVEGWTAADEYVSAIVAGRDGETEEALIARALREEGIVEVGGARRAS